MDRSHFAHHVDRWPAGSLRLRRCLLKGCERHFRPSRPQSRYCSAVCREAARRWRRWRASRRYRSSVNGRERRREQSRRYRVRRRERESASAEVTGSREGQRAGAEREDFCLRACARPGCYAEFGVVGGDSSRRFCSVACRLALRRVLDREARYRARRRRRHVKRLRRGGRRSHPP